MYPLSIKKKKQIGYWADTYWGTIAHYQICFVPVEAGPRRLRLSGKKERSGVAWTGQGDERQVDPTPRGWHMDPAVTADGGWIRQPRRTACESGSHGERTLFPCATHHPQLIAPTRPLDPWRRASVVREREQKREMRVCNAGERKKCGTRCHPVQMKRHNEP
jgi:hypothetical protein